MDVRQRRTRVGTADGALGFGIRTKADDERNREIFHSVASLAKFIREEREKGNVDTKVAKSS